MSLCDKSTEKVEFCEVQEEDLEPLNHLGGGNMQSKSLSEYEPHLHIYSMQDTQCDTRDLLRHTRVTGQSSWAEQSASVHDQALQEVVDAGLVTFVHQV